ncbi:MAG TPA: GMC family oxidoreductase N-terminal domain-containing protein [Caulobacteraceae bacterium]|nr:GMC family oxidoreductase N-terminal domain-containing protein [Caulobacteraceae bacterium]
MIDREREAVEGLLDQVAAGALDRRGFLARAAGAGLGGLIDWAAADQAFAGSAVQAANRRSLKRGYDYVVIGAGAAGCLIAARLAEAGAEVLLVESGGGDDSAQVTAPGLWFTNIGGPFDWNFKAEPSPGVAGRRVPMAMGHVLGGGTSINAMLWVRGLASDFDGWAAQACEGWSFADVLPVYRSLEDWEGGANAWRGAGGPMAITTAKTPHPTAPAFIEAARQTGTPVLEDVNGPMREGVGYVNMTITRQGVRASAARAYLRPVLGRPNLTLLLGTDATRLQFAGDRCKGVVLHRRGALREVVAAREVIVSAGGLFSARLLLLSGVGDAADLRRLGIRPVANLKGVGRNFQDHPLLFGVVSAYRGRMPPHAMTSNAVEAAAYVRSGAGGAEPDVKLVLMQVPVLTDEMRAAYGAPPPDAFTIAPALVRPTSRGRLSLASADWRQPARLEAGFFATEDDLDRTVRCIEMCRELGRQSAFDGIRAAEVVPGRSMTKAELATFARTAAISFGHPVGTCRMGVGEDAVVDPQLRVRGLEGLRVCDSSVMPTIITGPTQAPTQMIGAKAAAMILESA